MNDRPGQRGPRNTEYTQDNGVLTYLQVRESGHAVFLCLARDPWGQSTEACTALA
ncbi:hypothetical protein [Marinobacter caseinilyticus]|uniref:hypothetical protein n=1 Tax=Marinobacter caseinilyticus TaxID=2692195 RepID=UPI00140C36F3|nr:hypothetical protein [Marinobacter caseinilyticus]